MSGTTISGSYFSLVSLTDPDVNPVYVSGRLYASLYGDSSATWTITNVGQLGGDGVAIGLELASRGLVSNMSAGTIVGVHLGGYGTVDNAGTILEFGGGAVALSSGGVVINQQGGSISAAYGLGVTLGSGGGSVDNAGRISAATDGVVLSDGQSLTNQSTGTITAGVAVSALGTVSVTNYGQIDSVNPGAFAIYLGAGSVTNAASGTVAGYNGLSLAQTGTVVNAGHVEGSSGLGVVLASGGSVTNMAGGTIGGAIAGIYAKGGAASIANDGSISSPGAYGVRLAAGGTVTNGANASGAGIYGKSFGVYVSGATATVVNYGTIASGSGYPSYDAIRLTDGGSVTNAASATIGGYAFGMYLAGGASTLVNAGTITASSALPFTAGVYLEAGGSIANQTAGLIGGIAYGLVALASTTLTNDGTIASTGTFGAGLLGGGTIANGSAANTAALIDGMGAGLVVLDGGIVTNFGTIAGHQFGGVYLDGGGSVTNAANATISGYQYGVGLYGTSAATVLNTGTITGINHGIHASLSGVGAVVSNYGTITAMQNVGGAYGVLIQGDGTIRNLGTAALIQGYAGIEASLGTVVNAGTIASTRGSAGVAIQFIGGNARLIADPGAHFIGSVLGGSGGTNTLELASAASTGTLSGIGTQFVSFGTIIEDAGAVWTLSGDNTISAGATLTQLAGATLTNTGVLANNGAILLDPSVLITGDLIGAGSVTIDVGGTLEVHGSIGAGETIAFTGGASYAHFDSPTSVSGNVTNFDFGDTIDLKGIDQSSVSYDGSQVSFTGGGFALSLAAGNTLQVASSGDGALLTALCFCHDTHILTPSGEVRVQDLAVGDLVMTYRGAVRPIAWIGRGKMLATRGRRNAATPVIVRKGALADNVPIRDLRVTKGHALQIDDALIPVECLVNHRSILWDDRAQEVELYHIELASHDVLVANGAPAESYRDDGNRWLFQNARQNEALPQHKPCAPILTSGALVDETWRRLLQRAGHRPGLPLTDDPDLHLLVDGRRIDHDGNHVFRLSRHPRSVRIVSRAALPQELGLARDARPLGVALRCITATDGTLVRAMDASDHRLARGFHDFEAANGLRWTDGDAMLPPELYQDWSDGFEIVLHLGASTQYLHEGDALAA